jgi:hypothetical protein
MIVVRARCKHRCPMLEILICTGEVSIELVVNNKLWKCNTRLWKCDAHPPPTPISVYCDDSLTAFDKPLKDMEGSSFQRDPNSYVGAQNCALSCVRIQILIAGVEADGQTTTQEDNIIDLSDPADIGSTNVRLHRLLFQ